MTFAEQEEAAIAVLQHLLSLPDRPRHENYDEGTCFDPWDLFDCFYGSYSSEFDDMAIDVLEDVRDGTHRRSDLAGEMFREVLCKRGLCEYGTSPRVCFPCEPFKALLPELIARWRVYRSATWDDAG